MNQSENLSFLSGSIVFNILVGDQTAKTIDQIKNKNTTLLSKLKFEGKNILILIDVLKMRNISLAARRSWTSFFQDINFEKLAIITTDNHYQSIVRFFIFATGKVEKIKCFNNKQEGLVWLAQ